MPKMKREPEDDLPEPIFIDVDNIDNLLELVEDELTKHDNIEIQKMPRGYKVIIWR